MNVQRCSFAFVSCGEHIWEFGGSDHEDEVVDSSELYNANNDMWTMSIPIIENDFQLKIETIQI